MDAGAGAQSSATCAALNDPPTAEDERDLSKVERRREMFEALVGGYLGPSAGSNAAEKGHFGVSHYVRDGHPGSWRTHLAGDCYYKVHRPGQSARRVQFKMIESFERDEGPCAGWSTTTDRTQRGEAATKGVKRVKLA